MTNFFRECREFVGEGAGRGGSVARPRAASSGCAGHSAPAGACGSGAEAGQSERAAAAVLLLLSFFKLRNFSLKLVSQLIFVEFFFFFFLLPLFTQLSGRHFVVIGKVPQHSGAWKAMGGEGTNEAWADTPWSVGVCQSAPVKLMQERLITDKKPTVFMLKRYRRPRIPSCRFCYRPSPSCKRFPLQGASLGLVVKLCSLLSAMTCWSSCQSGILHPFLLSWNNRKICWQQTCPNPILHVSM